MNKVTRSRYLPPSEAEDLEMTAETPDETLEEIQSRADTIDSILQSQSAAAQAFVESIRNKLTRGLSPNFSIMEKVIQLQEAIQSMVQSQQLTRLVRKELAEKYEDELAAIRAEALFICRLCKNERAMRFVAIKHTAGDFECVDCYADSLGQERADQ